MKHIAFKYVGPNKDFREYLEVIAKLDNFAFGTATEHGRVNKEGNVRYE